MTMMQNPSSDMSSMLPLLLSSSSEGESVDMTSLFMMTTMMQNNCKDTNQQFNSLLPLLLFGEDEAENSNMKTLLLMQTMSQGTFLKNAIKY